MGLFLATITTVILLTSYANACGKQCSPIKVNTESPFAEAFDGSYHRIDDNQADYNWSAPEGYLYLEASIVGAIMTSGKKVLLVPLVFSSLDDEGNGTELVCLPDLGYYGTNDPIDRLIRGFFAMEAWCLTVPETVSPEGLNSTKLALSDYIYGRMEAMVLPPDWSVQPKEYILNLPRLFALWHVIQVQVGRARLRSHHVESTPPRPIWQVKQRWARLVLGTETAWESRVS